MAALGSQSIASSYEQLLHVDRDGGGNTTNHVSVKDGDNGTTFGFTIASDALMMSSTNRLEFGDNGTYISQKTNGHLDLDADTSIDINTGTLDLSGQTVDVTLNAAADALNFDSNTLSIDASNNRVGIGTAAPQSALSFATNSTIGVATTDGSDNSFISFSGGGSAGNNRGGTIYLSGNERTTYGGRIDLDAGNTDSSGIISMVTAGVERMHINYAGLVGIGDTANANMTQGLTINQGAADNEILAFKSSDVAHGMTSLTETDTFGIMKKEDSSAGGLNVMGTKDADGAASDALVLMGVLKEAASTTKSTSGRGVVRLSAAVTDGGTSAQAVGSDGNLVSIDAWGTTRFIFDTEGSFHADVESTTFDAYDDAQLVRAYDLSHGKGMIESKFDQFIDYNHETLAELKLVGREEDGTPNRMVNVTGMQHLHNGAIWQQYTEMQKMKELMYDTMVEMLGKEKADQKLTDHDVKLLDNKTLLN